MADVIVIGDGHGLRIEVCHRNQPKKSKLLLYKLLFSLNIDYTQATRWSALVIKVSVVCMGVHVSLCLKEELA